MKRFDWKKLKENKVDISQISERVLLLNLYITQGLSFLLGLIIIFLQNRNPLKLFGPFMTEIVVWGSLFAGLFILANFIVARTMPEDLMDDGGINEKLFRNRPLWHIAVIALVVAVCEELLFRGAVQHAFGPYWTSILFAAIHVRYLQHWLMTGLVFGISYGLGWIYIQTGSLLTPIIAHFLIDFILGCFIKYRRES